MTSIESQQCSVDSCSLYCYWCMTDHKRKTSTAECSAQRFLSHNSLRKDSVPQFATDKLASSGTVERAYFSH